jgi:hypothetical protein
MMHWINPRDFIGHCYVVNSVHNNRKMAMSSTTLSGGYAGSIIAELALEDLERRIGWRTNDLGEFSVGESEVVAHLGTALTWKKSAGDTQQQVGRHGQCL